jgi:hypothetical protein
LLKSTSSVNTRSNKSKLRKLPDENTNEQTVYDLNSFMDASNVTLQNEESTENNETEHVYNKNGMYLFFQTRTLYYIYSMIFRRYICFCYQ